MAVALEAEGEEAAAGGWRARRGARPRVLAELGGVGTGAAFGAVEVGVRDSCFCALRGGAFGVGDGPEAGAGAGAGAGVEAEAGAGAGDGADAAAAAPGVVAGAFAARTLFFFARRLLEPLPGLGVCAEVEAVGVGVVAEATEALTAAITAAGDTEPSVTIGTAKAAVGIGRGVGAGAGAREWAVAAVAVVESAVCASDWGVSG